MGHDVTCVDVDEKKVRLMESGVSPIYEEGLEELMRKNNATGRRGSLVKQAGQIRLAFYIIPPEISSVGIVSFPGFISGIVSDHRAWRESFWLRYGAVRISPTSGRATASGLTGIIWRRCGGIISMPE